MHFACKHATASRKQILAAAIAASTLAACSGGDTSAPPPTPAQVLASTTRTYLHYANRLPNVPTTMAGTLTTIDPAAPTVMTNTNNALVGGTQIGVVYAGNYSGGGTISDHHRYAVVFVDSATGFLMKQSAVPSGATPPAAVQVSSASGITAGPGDASVNAAATDLCGIGIETDYKNPDNSVVLISQAGPNMTCGDADDVGYWTRLGTASTTAMTPYPAAGISPGTVQSRIAVYDSTTGAITGYIAADSTNTTTNNLVQVDANFANPVAATNGLTGITGVTRLARNPSTGVFLLNVVTTASSAIYTYNPTTKTLGASALATLSAVGPLGRYVADNTDLYFVDNVPTPNALYKISVTSPAAATVVVTEGTAGTTAIRSLFNTPTRIVYLMLDTGIGGVQFRSVAKSAASPTNATSTAVYPSTPTGLDGIYVAGVTAAGELYINRIFGSPPAAQPGTGIAVGVKDDGTGLVTIADAWWQQVFLNTTYTTPVRYTARAVLLQRAAAGANSDATGTLKIYDSPTGSVVGTIATTVPNDIVNLGYPQSPGVAAAGPRTLVSGYPNTGGPDQFYLDAAAGTFYRITTGLSTVPVN